MFEQLFNINWLFKTTCSLTYYCIHSDLAKRFKLSLIRFNYTTRDAILYFKTKSEWKNVLVTLFFKCCICSPYCQTVPDTFRSGWYMKMININYIDKLQTNFTIISIPINYTHLPSIKYQKICMRQNLYFKKKNTTINLWLKRRQHISNITKKHFAN